MDKATQNRVNKLFTWFEENKFDSNTDLDHVTALVCQFSDYIDNMRDDELAQELAIPYEETSMIEKARAEIGKGINAWLGL